MEHALRVVYYQWDGLYMLVSEHYIQLSSTNEFDDVGVNFGKQEGVGFSRSEGGRRDIACKKPEITSKEGNNVAKCLNIYRGLDATTRPQKSY